MSLQTRTMRISTLASLTTVVVAMLVASPLMAQTYESAPVLPEYKMISDGPVLKKEGGNLIFEPLTDAQKKSISSRNRDARQKISEGEKLAEAALEGGGDLANPEIKKFFEGYVFAEMTQTSEDKISRLGEMRADFLKDYLSRNVTGAKRTQFINTIVIPSLGKIITGRDLSQNADVNYHPAARLSAVYLLGMLDSQGADRLANPKKDPIPSADALRSLISIYETEDTQKYPAYLKVAALAGIQRHVEIDNVLPGQIDAASRQKIASTAVGILMAASPEDQSESDANLDYWLKRRSMQILGFLKDPSALDTILTVLQSPNASTWLKYDALEAIGRLDLTNLPAAKAGEVSLAITEVLANYYETESKRIDQKVSQLVYDNMLFQDLDLEKTGTDFGNTSSVGGGGAFGGGGPGDGMGGLGGGLGGGPGMGGGLGGFGGAFGGRGGGTTTGETKPLVELPNYELNIARRRIKSYAYTAKEILGGENSGLTGLADDTMKQFNGDVVKELNRLLDESNVGIIDLDDRSRLRDDVNQDDVEPKSVARQLSELCSTAADKLKSKVRTQKGEGNEDLLNAADKSGDAGEKKDDDFGF